LALLEEIEWWGRQFPCEGGLLDQPSTLINDLRRVRTAIQHYRNSQENAEKMLDQIGSLRQQAMSMAGQGDTT
jgi:hypothetical protein